MSTNTDHVVSLENVEVHFSNERLFGLLGTDTVHAVDDVSLDIPENDVVALVGESGCGKTTLGKTAIGVQRPTGGTVRYRGQDIWETKDRQGLLKRNGDADAVSWGEIRRSLQMIHQDPGSSLNSNYTVQSILADPLKKWQPNLNREDRQSRIFGLLEYVGMAPPDDYATRYPHQLSGGEQQRVALIRALLMNPDLILADEAISALDVSLRVEMMNLFLELQEQFNTSFLFISHDLSNARFLAEKADGRIGIMYLGELVEIGPAEQIIKNPQHPYTKALRWATPNLYPKQGREEMPMRSIDIPDPIDPPSGCRFHTRCPEAREACRESTPPSYEIGDRHTSACFRVDDDHGYWDSPSLVSDELGDTFQSNVSEDASADD
jgi:peptide/nickel transport system ATP-binding protein